MGWWYDSSRLAKKRWWKIKSFIKKLKAIQLLSIFYCNYIYYNIIYQSFNSKLIERKMDKNEIIDFFKDLILIVVIVLVVRTFIAMPFQINWQSMYSSYFDREFIIVDRLSYLIWNPDRWDVIVFKPNVSEEKKYFLKRIIGIPGDSVKIEDGIVYVKKQTDTEYIELDEQYLNEENKWFTFVWWSKAMHQYNLWEDQFFVLGDNRNHSTDSRECFSSCAIQWRTSFIDASDITWKVFLDLWYYNFKSFSFMQPNLWIDTTPRFFDSPSSYDY